MTPQPDLLHLQQLSRSYTLAREHLWAAPPVVHALQDVNLRMTTGRHLGVVGESGSGKSTLARLVMALEAPSAGSVEFMGQNLHQLAPAALRSARRNFQMVFQDPYGSLDPRQTVLKIVTEPLCMLPPSSAAEQRAQAADMLQAVGLRASDLDKFPHEFSGGQRQRVAMARALITRPRLVVADEPVSALDVSVQAQVLNLMQDLAQQLGLTYLLISHDLAVVNHMCDEVAVIYQGRIVEQGSPDTLFKNAAHPYTRALLAAVPRIFPRPTPGQRRHIKQPITQPITRNLSAGAPASGCPYAPNCPQATSVCDEMRPNLNAVAAKHWVACHFSTDHLNGAAP